MRTVRSLGVIALLSTGACLGLWACGSSNGGSGGGGSDAAEDGSSEGASEAATGTGDSTIGDGATEGGADVLSVADGGDATAIVEGGDGGSDAPLEAFVDVGTTLDGAVCNGGVFSVTTAKPVLAWSGSSTGISITGSGFAATPKVYLQPATGSDAGIEAGAGWVQLYHTAFVSSTSITSIVPQGTPTGTYTVVVVNPDTCAEWGPTLDVVANPPPIVDNVSPGAGITSSATNVTVTGCHFTSSATLSTVDSAGMATSQTVTASITCGSDAGADAGATCSDGSPLCTMKGTLNVPTVGAYVVRVTDPIPYDPIDAFGDWGTFVVTNPSGKLSSTGQPTGAGLHTGRRALGATSGRINAASRFVYAIGGEDASGTALSTVEVGPVDIYGTLGTWFVQKNQLVVPRSGLAVTRQGQYLYAIGGTSSTGGTGGTAPTGTPLATVERAVILDPAGAPLLTDPPTTTGGTGTLAAGTWYYQVSALGGPNGETLGSNEVVSNLSAAGEVTLTWSAVLGATGYRVYRSPAADGMSGSEVLLSTGAITATTYVDDGTAAAASPTETPNLPGATGTWQTVTGSPLVNARLDTNATVAPDPTGQLYVYVAGGWGSACLGPDAGAAGEMNCYEVASISVDGSTLGAFSVDTTHTFLFARMRHGFTAMTAANGPSAFSTFFGTNGALLLIGGGPGINSTSGATVEYAVVGTGGKVTTAWANPGGFSLQRDGSQLQVANGYSYGFLGGTAPGNYTSTADLSTTTTLTDAGAGVLQYGSWSSSTLQLSSKVARMGMAHDSAYFFVIGGTSNDTDALASVYQILD